MTPEEKIAFIQMEKDIQGLVQKQDINSQKLDEVLKALKGDEYGNPGFVGRVTTMENDVKILKEDRIQNKFYIRIITWLIAVIATGMIGFILQTILNKK